MGIGIIMKKRDVTFPYCLMQVFYWVGFAVLSPFASFYMLSFGISNTTIGIMLAIAALVAAVAQPILGAVVDKSRRFYNRHLMIILGLGTALLSGVLAIIGAPPIAVVIALYAGSYLGLQILQPFANAIGMEYINSGYGLHFGVGRAAGSIGYALAAAVMGIMTVRTGARCVPIAFATTFIIMAIGLIVGMPAIKEKNTGNDDKIKPVGPLAFMLRYKSFMLMLVGLVCIYYTHNTIGTYALQIVSDKGGNSETVGIGSAIAAILEIVPMLFFSKLRKHFRLNNLISVSAVFFTLKILATLLVPNVISYYIIQVFQIGGWGVMAMSVVYYANETIDRENSSQAQAFLGVTLTLGSVLATSLGGVMIDKFGAPDLLKMGVVVGIIGTIIVTIATHLRRTNNERIS